MLIVSGLWEEVCGFIPKSALFIEVFRIISAGTEMGISNEKHSGHQQLHRDFKGPGSKAYD